MASKSVGEVKVGDIISVFATRDTINYFTPAKVTKLNPHRVYDSVNPSKQKVIQEIFYQAEKGPLKGDELSVLMREDQKVQIPPKPSKFTQIMRILFA